MTRRPSRFRQSDLSRALRAAEKAGEGWRVLVRPDGTIEIAKRSGDKRGDGLDEPHDASEPNEWDGTRPW